MSKTETEQEIRQRRENEAVMAAKKMLDKLSADELSSAQERMSNDVKEIIAKQAKEDPGVTIGIKAVVKEKKMDETLDKDFNEALDELYDTNTEDAITNKKFNDALDEMWR